MSHAELALVGVVLLAGFVQGVVGFGFGMISMAVLPLWFEVREAVPVVSLLGVVICVAVGWRWRHGLQVGEIKPLLIGVAVGAPLGAYFLSRVERELAIGALGAVILCVALPSLVAASKRGNSAARRPRGLERFAILAGALSGLFGGAFNSGGPPLILYGSASAWSPAAFRANLQAVFLFSSLLQLAVLASAGVATTGSLSLALIGLPAILVGVALGGACASRVDAHKFRVMIWVLLLALGANYLRQAFV